MKRRSLLKGLGAVGAGLATGFRLPLAHATDHRGRFFVFVQADGGWDPTSFCDPKVNQVGEEIINRWAEHDEPRQAGNIPYAPFANNEVFFENHHDKMLVINGVDAQTNSHTAGIVHNWSGRISEGYPTITALLANHYGGGLSAPYLSYGGFSQTSGIARFTRLREPELLLDLASPERMDPDRRFVAEADWADLTSHRSDTARRLAAVPNLMPMDEVNRELHRLANETTEGLEAYAAAIAETDRLEEPENYRDPAGLYRSELRRQAQLTVLAFKTGVAVSADLWLGGFDTHDNHDRKYRWLLGNLTNGVDYLWDYAEQQGVANDMVVVMGSDFGRTNRYNDQNGKDHWPFGSYIVMQKGQSWTDRVVGETDELHVPYKMDPATLERAGETNPRGTHIYPKHVHKALRKYLGIEDSLGALRFPFNNTEDFAFFG